MTLKTHDVPQVVFNRTIRQAQGIPGLLEAAHKFAANGRAESVWDAVLMLKSRNNREVMDVTLRPRRPASRPVVRRPQASRARRTARTASRFAAPSSSDDPEPEPPPPHFRQFSPWTATA